MSRRHTYEISLDWTGNRGQGTADYRAYDRAYMTESLGRPQILGSSDPAFRGDRSRWNPELLLVAALSQCHLLVYLHQCAINGVVVTTYRDAATGTMVETEDGGGRFEEVILRPAVTVSEAGMLERAEQLHEDSCAIASSPLQSTSRCGMNPSSASILGPGSRMRDHQPQPPTLPASTPRHARRALDTELTEAVTPIGSRLPPNAYGRPLTWVTDPSTTTPADVTSRSRSRDARLTEECS
jgi:organic hydroperoxide reductase OsmC/OhrA